jgi:hypothetical protein
MNTEKMYYVPLTGAITHINYCRIRRVIREKKSSLNKPLVLIYDFPMTRGNIFLFVLRWQYSLEIRNTSACSNVRSLIYDL